MPAHVKSTIIGPSLSVRPAGQLLVSHRSCAVLPQIPITDGRLNLGTWQGIYLCEHRNRGGWGGGHVRRVVVTLQGQLKDGASLDDGGAAAAGGEGGGGGSRFKKKR